jgi:hypothetical protein
MRHPRAARLVATVLFTTSLLAAQNPAVAQSQPLSPHAQDVAELIGVKSEVERMLALSRERAPGVPMTAEELSLRQDILEVVTTASLDCDSVLAEIANERARIMEVRAYLSSRRDAAVNLATIGNLVTGTGLGIAVNALQFSSSTANIGNGIGVGSGIGSTLLSIVGIRLQRGGLRSVGRVPNMLAVPFGRSPVLNSDYPDDVRQYLSRVPAGFPAPLRTRLQQLMQEWVDVGRIDPPNSPKRQKEVDQLTASLNSKQKLSIDALINRSAMLGDVAGTVSLMKRDLGELMRAIRRRN